MLKDICLPNWLDNLIYNELNGNYCRSCSNMTVIDWNKCDVLTYLGTYFPRSYAESYCIFSEFLKANLINWENRNRISVFDFCCGTGGELIGMLVVIKENLPRIKRLEILALDGNQDSLRIMEEIIDRYSSLIDIKIELKIAPVLINDIDDFCIIDEIINKKFDIIISFKAICEFLTKKRFEEQNAYKSVIQFFLSKLNIDGIMFIAEITTFNKTVNEWHPVALDYGINECDCNVIFRNDGYNLKFTVTHSLQLNDESKIAWRIIKK